MRIINDEHLTCVTSTGATTASDRGSTSPTIASPTTATTIIPTTATEKAQALSGPTTSHCDRCSTSTTRHGVFRRQDCFCERESEYAEEAYETPSEESRVSRSSWSSCLSYYGDDDLMFDPSSSEFGLEYSTSDDEDDDNALRRSSLHVRFSTEPPIAHYFTKPTEEEKKMMYYNAVDYQVFVTDYYLEQMGIDVHDERDVIKITLEDEDDDDLDVDAAEVQEIIEYV